MKTRVHSAVLRDGKILMVLHRAGYREYWTLPGGGVEAGESLSEAAVREVREETGLDVRVLRLLYEGPFAVAEPGGYEWEAGFLAEAVDAAQEATLGFDPEETGLMPQARLLQGIRWFSLNEKREDGQVSQVIAALQVD